jgi:hypothetical protein
MGNSSGWVARLVERWQLGLIYNLSSGAPTSITATTMLYGNGLPDVRHPVDFNKLKGMRWDIRNTPTSNFLEGRYFDENDVFVKVDDPLCFSVTNLDNLSGLVPTTGSPQPALHPQCAGYGRPGRHTGFGAGIFVWFAGNGHENASDHSSASPTG